MALKSIKKEKNSLKTKRKGTAISAPYFLLICKKNRLNERKAQTKPQEYPPLTAMYAINQTVGTTSSSGAVGAPGPTTGSSSSPEPGPV